MAKTQEVEVVVEEVEAKKNPMLDTAHKALLVGFGALGMGQDLLVDGREEANEFFNKLVERGEKVESEGRQWLDKRLSREKVEVDAEAEVVVETA